jgi:hypothetical protein
VAGADIDKEKESISVDQIAGKDDITNIFRSLMVTNLLECIFEYPNLPQDSHDISVN